MPTIRRTYSEGRMNLDTENRLLPDGEYREAFNAIVFNNESNEEGSVKKSYSNKKLTNLDLGANPICLGGYSNPARHRVYWLILSDSGCYLIEYDFTNNIATFVLKDTRPVGSRVFNLKEDFFCTGIDILSHDEIGKELFLITDDNMQPLCFNIERAKTWAENGFEKEDIFLIKKPPRFAPTTTPTFVDNAGNNLEEKFLSFSYRYKYLDGEYSALSSYSNYNFYPDKFKLDYESLDNVGMVNYYNSVHIAFNTGDKRVTDIQIIAKESNSNTLFLVETINKINQNWGNNQTKSIIFSNNKIYTALPERELYRSFDNVPLKAKALTLIGNLAVFGNFEEGYDLVESDGRKMKLNYKLSLLSDDFTGKPLPISITSGSVTNNKLTIDFTGFKLKTGSEFNLFFSLANNQTPARNYSNNASFLLTKDFINTADLAVDDDFIFFVTKYMTNLFLSNYTINEIPNSEFDSNTTFTIDSYTNTTITIKSASLTFKVGTVPTVIDWGFRNNSGALFYEIGGSSTLKTNRDYEVGFVYMDDFGRHTTVLTQIKNTLYVPHEKALSRNKLKVNISHNPPAFADRFKIVVKSQSLHYHTIYATTFYIDGLYRWIKLEGNNKDKVKVGDFLIFKADTNGFVEKLTKVKVLEIETKDKDFITGNVDLNGAQISEFAGLYMKIKTPAGVSMDYIKDGFITKTGHASSRGDNFNLHVGPFSNLVDGAYVDIPIKQGSRIDIELSNGKYGKDGGNVRFSKTYYVSADYANLEEWYVAEVNNNTGDFSYPTNGVVRGTIKSIFGIKIFTPSSTGALYLQIHNELNGNGQHPSYMDGTIKIATANGVLIFETEEKKNTDREIYFETAQTFEIINGKHKGNLQDQTTSLPAEISLDYFNCYAMKNGGESYVVKDAFNKPYLNVDLRPCTVYIEEYKRIRRYADLTYSEPYVESAGMNGLNVFNLSTANFKDDLDKQYGSIQKIHSRENDIVVLQEEKSGKVLFNKQAIFTAEGNAALTAAPNVLGQYIPYMGNRGIGTNPESFSVDDFGRIKYASVRNGTIIRLSIDGIEDIVYGVKNFFRDLFVNRTKGKIISGYDPYLNLTAFTIGDNIVETPIYNCGNEIIKNNLTRPFNYTLKLNSLTGDLVFNYNIKEGFATIAVTYNGEPYVVSGVSGTGNITIDRQNLLDTKASVTITPVSPSISFSLVNNCPIGKPLEIILIVLNDEKDLNKTIINQFRSGTNDFIENEDLFTGNPITKFEKISGLEGQNLFPKQGSIVTIQSVKDALSTGEFLLTKCNRIGYLISGTNYTESNITTLLTNTQFLTLAETIQGINQKTFSGNFVFSRTAINQKLYLVWDYRDIENCGVTPFPIDLCYNPTDFTLACACS
jgi:hypothetical protein